MIIEDELQSVLDAYLKAYRAGDAARCASVYSDNAQIFSPYGPPASGRDQIEELHCDWVAEGSPGKRLEIVEAGSDGNLAWCFARYSEGSETGVGYSLNVFERQPGGNWLIRMSNLNETG